MLIEIICGGVRLNFNPAFVYIVEFDEAELQIDLIFAKRQENGIVNIDKRLFCLDNLENANKVLELLKNHINNPSPSVSLNFNALGFPVQIR